MTAMQVLSLAILSLISFLSHAHTMKLADHSPPSPELPTSLSDPYIWKVDCERGWLDATVRVAWKNPTAIPGPYSVEVYYITEDKLYVQLQTVSLTDYDLLQVKFKANDEWKRCCEEKVVISIRGQKKSICSASSIQLAKICPNVIQENDRNPDETDMLFFTTKKAPHRSM